MGQLQAVGVALVLVASGWAQAPPAERPASWDAASGSLFFLASEQKTWEAADTPDREWLLTEPISPRLFVLLNPQATTMAMRRGQYEGLAEADHAAAVERTLARWRAWLQPAFVPAAEQVRVIRHNPPPWPGPKPPLLPPPRPPLAYASLQTPRANVLLLHRLDSESWFYAEQPDPLPAGGRPLLAEELVRPELLAAQRAVLAGGPTPAAAAFVRTLTRRRAFDPQGPFAPVRILLGHVLSADSLALRAPGYPS